MKLEDRLIDILLKKINNVKFRKQRLSFKVLHIIWYLFFSIPRYLVWFFTKRIVCLIIGCNIMITEGGFVEECLRCFACDDFGELSKHKLIKRR